MLMKDKTMILIEEQLDIYNQELRELDSYYKNIEVSEKTIDMCNKYIRERTRIVGAIDALVRFRLRWCEENI